MPLDGGGPRNGSEGGVTRCKFQFIKELKRYGWQRLGAVQKLFVQNAQDEFVSARRRREACRGTLTDDNAAMADSDKHYV